MQFVWLYIDDLVGKGLEWYVLAEFLYYTSLTLVPMALPLAILLSSLMTFGNLAENYELVAFKASGISLQKVMQPLIVVSIITASFAFLFSNNVLPWAKLKMGAMLYDIKNKKPAIDIRPGMFYYGIQNIVIRAGSKSKDGKELYDVIVYDHSKHDGNNKVILAQKAIIYTEKEKGYLVMNLKNGNSYDQSKNQGKNKSERLPLTHTVFDDYVIRFDLSPFEMERTDEGLFRDNYQMMNTSQLKRSSDSMEVSLKFRYSELGNTVRNNFGYLNPYFSSNNAIQKPVSKSATLILPLEANYPMGDRERIFEVAKALCGSNLAFVESSRDDLESRLKTISKHYIEFNRKFTLSVACIVLFFIGAPLGAIIRKGGLGLPIVVSTIIFIFFHIISISAEKTAKEGKVNPSVAMWLPTFIFLPVGIFLTAKATTDSVIFDIELYKKILNPSNAKMNTELKQPS